MAYGQALDALGDPTRRAIFERLRVGPRSVGGIAQGLPVSRPAVSQHLRVLKDAGLVTDAREGTRRVYRLDPSGLGVLRAYLEEFWDGVLSDFKAEAEGRGRTGDAGGRREGGEGWTRPRRSSRSTRR